MASPSLSVDASLGTPTTGVNVSPQKVAVKGSTRRRSTLESSLRGVDLERSWCYLFINGYPTNDTLAIKQQSIDKDLEKLLSWVARLDPRPYVWQYNDTYKEGSRRADDQKIRTVFGTKRLNPTLIYLSGHTELPPHSPTDGPAYIPADHPTAPNKFIPYETMRQLLLKNPDSAPLLFITEVCYCSNFLRLPYELVHEGDSIQWKETGYPNIEGSSIVAHFAATSPDERARSFDNGAVFTKALYNIDPKVGMSVRGIAKELQGAINTIMATDKKNIQHPKIYCSQKTENPHFFKALGLFAPQDSDSSVGGDSDSNA